MAKTLRGQTVFVTGAGGFIGSAVVRALVKRRAIVHALVGLPEHPRHALPSGVVTFWADIRDSEAICRHAAGTDVVVHLAGPASVQASFESPIEFALVHVGGTSVVLEATRKLGIRRFVYISSAEVYGRTERLPVAEDHPLEARSPYAAAKIGAEQFVQASTFSTGIEAIVLRPFSIYGPGSSCQSLIGTILRQARDQDCLTLNDLRPVRDYCHVEDLAEAVVRACTAPTSGFCVVNVGTGLGTSVIDLARLILSALGRDIPVREAPGSRRPPESEIYHLIANPRKAYEVLGWKAEVTLQAGLKQLCTLRRAPD